MIFKKSGYVPVKLLLKHISIFIFILEALSARPKITNTRPITSTNAKFINKTLNSDSSSSLKTEYSGMGAVIPNYEQLQNILKASQEIYFNNIEQDSLPDKIDHSQSKWFPPIGDQGAEGSCVAWATGYYVKTFQEAKEHDWDLSAAEWIKDGSGYPAIEAQNKIISPDFIYHLTNNGQDRGISVFRAINFIQRYGAASWETMPNDPDTFTTWPSTQGWREAILYRGASSPLFLIDTNATQNKLFKQVLASGKLALIHINAYKYSQLSEKDLWTIDNYQTNIFNHLNAVVGYDDDFGPYVENGDTTYGAFKVVNSSGKGGWENDPDGFYYISYRCLQKYIKFAILFNDRIDYQPSILANFKISHPYRGEIRIDLGLNANNENIISKQFIEYNNSEDTNPFPSNSMIFDISNFSNLLNPSLDSVYIDLYDQGQYSETALLDSLSIEFLEDGRVTKNYQYLNGDSVLRTRNNQHSRENIIIHSDPSLSLSRDTIDFSEIYLNTTDTAVVKIYNSSNQSYLLETELNSSQFKVSNTRTYIDPRQIRTFQIIFDPSQSGNYNAKLVFNYEDGTRTVQISGIAKNYPEYLISDQEIDFEIRTGELDSGEIFIENRGLDTLNYAFELAIDTTDILVKKDIPGIYPSNLKVLLYDNLRPDQQSLTKQYLEKLGVYVELLSRPDALQDSLLEAYDLLYVKKGDVNFLRDQGDVIQNYIEKGGGMIIEQPDREYSVRIMPPEFKIGVLNSVSEINPDYIEYTQQGKRHPMLNALPERGYCGSYDVIKMNDLGEGFEVLAVNSLDTNNVALAAGNYGKGRIVVHTGEIGQNNRRSSYLFVQRLLEWTAGKAISFSISNTRDNLLPEESKSVQFIVNSEVLFDGDYNLISSFLPSGESSGHQNIDIQMDLQGEPQIEISKDTIDFDTVFLRATDSVALKISNTGSAILKLSNISIFGSERFYSDKDSLHILPGRDESIMVYFNPLLSGEYKATLEFKAPDFEQLNRKITLLGQGVTPPQLGTVPDSLVKYMGINDSSSRQINLTNQGQAPLEFDISVTGAEKSIIEEYLSNLATYVSGIHYSKGSLYFIKRTDNKLFRYDLEGDYTEELFTIPYNSYSLASDGENFYIGTYLGYIYGYDQAGEQVVEIKTPFRNQIAFDFTGSVFIICSSYSTLSKFAIMDKNGNTLQEIHYPGCYSDEVCVQVNWLDEHKGGNLWGIFYNYRTENYWLNQLNYSSESIDFVRRYQMIPGAENLTHDGDNFWVSTMDGSLLKIQDKIDNLNWLQLSQNQGSIIPQNRETINLKFNTRGMQPGRYTANIILTTNDPDQDVLTIPAELFLAGSYEMQLAKNWELRGLPVEPTSNQVDNIFNLDSTQYNLYAWYQTYFSPDSLFFGQGFWIKSGQERNLILNGLPDDDITLNLQKGWNIISGPSVPLHIAQIMDKDNVMSFPLIFNYRNSYIRSDSLLPGHGYWVYASEKGRIDLREDAAYLPEQLKIFEYLPDLNEYPFLSIKDSDSNQTSIYYDVEFNYDQQSQYFKLPPLPPEKVFDARILDGYYATDSNNFHIKIQTSAYPVQLTNFNQKQNGQFQYQIVGEKGRKIDFDSQNHLILRNPEQDTLYFQKIRIAPDDFQLSNNYPNPFNSQTIIDYALPVKTNVEISVFDITGTRVTTLFSGIREKGYYQIKWNGENDSGQQVGSGLYFLNFYSREYQTSRKMVLVK